MLRAVTRLLHDDAALIVFSMPLPRHTRHCFSCHMFIPRYRADTQRCLCHSAVACAIDDYFATRYFAMRYAIYLLSAFMPLIYITPCYVAALFRHHVMVTADSRLICRLLIFAFRYARRRHRPRAWRCHASADADDAAMSALYMPRCTLPLPIRRYAHAAITFRRDAGAAYAAASPLILMLDIALPPRH